MSNSIFVALLNRRIESFVSTYIEDSRSLFFKQDSLYHPGEYGRYREQTFKELLKHVINSNYDISEGFVITSKDHISTQCDVVVYEGEDTPLLRNDISQFFTIESVLSIGEIKSDLSKAQFKDALKKLAINKMLRNDASSTIKAKRGSFIEYEQLVSFLVCKKLNFDISTIDFDELYNGIEHQYRHNAILSLEQGVWTYILRFKDFPEPMRSHTESIGIKMDSSVIYEHPIHGENDSIYFCENSFFNYDEMNIYNHIRKFLLIIGTAIERTNLYNSEMLLYLDELTDEIFI
ncbi:hypothetical protein JNUCC31_27820 [Paenibacillus sp. JNUCC31]|uniref:DUF6602 domain-containing protein n=1 Tax=Paenibacillus sp. JNUCC-31 TaxID=2777983 RepID=UPI0017847FFD|nr:DUF6602 domain-containing protein [Paenibacillus sp. JNUCC-31]QOS78476.1 hypothetical protein JNUCC31_27820 [Paenibacillus sp. JNUCC-31]